MRIYDNLLNNSLYIKYIYKYTSRNKCILPRTCWHLDKFNRTSIPYLGF